MTENEKLRTLLKEARDITQDSLDSNTAGFEDEEEVCKCNGCERYRSIIQRIDVALAEPVELSESEYAMHARIRADYDKTVADAWRAALTKVERERDEARAEIERLTPLLDAVRAARSMLCQLQDHVSDQACDELLSILSDEPLDADGNLYRSPSEAAYQQGAEAMREAAARVIEAKVSNPYINRRMAEEVRALPLPKEKL
jgi:hypothetical protein